MNGGQNMSKYAFGGRHGEPKTPFPFMFFLYVIHDMVCRRSMIINADHPSTLCFAAHLFYLINYDKNNYFQLISSTLIKKILNKFNLIFLSNKFYNLHLILNKSWFKNISLIIKILLLVILNIKLFSFLKKVI